MRIEIRSPLAGAVALGTLVPGTVAAGLFADGDAVPPAGTEPAVVLATGTSLLVPCGALPDAIGAVVVVGAGPNIVGLPLARCQFSYSMNRETEKTIQRMVRRVSIEAVGSVIWWMAGAGRRGRTAPLAQRERRTLRSGDADVTEVPARGVDGPPPAGGTGSWPPGCHG